MPSLPGEATLTLAPVNTGFVFDKSTGFKLDIEDRMVSGSGWHYLVRIWQLFFGRRQTRPLSR